MSRATWVFAGLGFAVIVLLLSWMARTLDTKAPIRIERGPPTPVPEPVRTFPEEEQAERDRATMESIVVRLAPSLARRAAEQAFPGEEAARARCTFTAARLVHRDETSAYWDAEYSCVDPLAAGAYPNPTSVSVRLARDGARWVAAD
jgi:hypothetical protein